MGSLGPFEIALIFLVILLVFGAKRIPEIARGLGKGIREFKTATKEISKEFDVKDAPNQIQPPGQPMYGTPAPRTDVSQQPVPPAPAPAPAAVPAAPQPAPAAVPAAPQPAPAAAPQPASPPASPPPDPHQPPSGG